MTKWWVGLKGDNIVLVYANRKPTYLTKVDKGHIKLSNLIRNSQLHEYPAYVSFLRSSIE